MKQVILSLFISLLLFSVANQTFAFNGGGGGDAGCTSSGCKIDNPLGEGTTPQMLIGRVINGFLGIVGSLALVMFIYGGFTWMTAAGSSEAVSKGKNVIIWAVLGLIVIFSAYAMVNFVFDDILGNQGG